LEAGSAFRIPTFRNYLFGEPSSGFTPGLGSASIIVVDKVKPKQKYKFKKDKENGAKEVGLQELANMRKEILGEEL
jgi:hypothetical protein